MTELPNNPPLRRVLTLPLVVLYGLGVTVGAGIYVLIGETVAQAGAFAPLSFILAATVVGFTALSYAELSTRFPVSAGAAVYVSAGLKRVWLAQAVGLAVALSGIVSAAAVAIGAGQYVANLFGVPGNLMAILVIVAMGGLAWWGITQSVGAAATITVIEIAGLVGVVVWSLAFVEPSGLMVREFVPPLTGGHWAAIAGASILAFFAFVGFEDIVNVAEETLNPQHVLPRAIALTLVLTTLVYITVVAAVLLAVPMEDLAGSDAPLALVFNAAPYWVQTAFSAIAVIATINGVLIQIIMASRVLYGMADRGQLPKLFSHVSARTRTPGISTACVILLILGFSQFLPIERLASYTSQIVLLIFVFVNLSLIALKRQGDTTIDHFKTPFLVPIFGLVTSLALLFVSVRF